MTRKTVELEIGNEEAKKLFYNLTRFGGVGIWFKGSLVDEFAVGMTVDQIWKIKQRTGRPILNRKYVYAYEKYINSWTSQLVLVLTDNEEKFRDFCKSRFDEDKNLDELDYEDFCYNCGLKEFKKKVVDF